jgi:hypothetical protein
MIKQALLVIFTTLVLNSFPQIAINTDGSIPDNSAMLDVKSTTKGVLFPRQTYNELLAMINPAEGLMVYCTNCGSNASGSLVIFSSGIWNIINFNCLTQSNHINEQYSSFTDCRDA